MISVHHVSALDQALKVISSGGLVVFPTDTVYGLGVSAFNQQGIERIFEVKGRDPSKAIAVLIADVSQLILVAGGMNSNAEKIGGRYWPGALTLIIPSNSHLPPNISPLPTIGVRIPNHEFARQLIRLTGPLATTSANLSDKPSAVTVHEAIDQLGESVDLYIDGGQTSGGIASTVVDCTKEPPSILRPGPITEADIKTALEGVRFGAGR
jgi:L-threonylcarbamoyladenylate synthase